MEITSENFQDRLPEIEKAIETSTFMAIDGEFTGLNAYRNISAFDTPAERYDKVKDSARQFLLIQFGLSTFHHIKSSDTFESRTYNFYVWPRPCSRNAPDPRFLCQTSSIDFLTNQNFDFNKLFKQGVSYLRPVELQKLTDSLRGRQEHRRQSLQGAEVERASQPITIPEDQEKFLAEVHGKITRFIASEEQQMELEKCNGFQRRLIYQTAKEKYKDLSLSSINNAQGDRVILVVKADEEEQQRLAGLRDEAELTDLETALGFTRVINKMTESGKLVIGHNMILDVAQTVNQFCGPLPDTLLEFKSMLTSVFPRLVDTKLMANTIPFKQEIYNSSLEELYRIVQCAPYSLPEVRPAEAGLGYDQGSDKYHEAGYDAYITGLCFIAMANRLGQLCNTAEGKSKTRVLPDSPHLQPFLNKLYLMKIADIPYLNLTGEDLSPERSHVFHIEFPKEWKTSDILHLFSPFGHVFVSWIDDTSAFVSLKDKDWSNQVLSNFQSTDVPYTVRSYEAFTRLKEERAAHVMIAQSCGVTPTMERVFLPPSKAALNGDKKRHLVDESGNFIKRQRPFEEPEWE